MDITLAPIQHTELSVDNIDKHTVQQLRDIVKQHKLHFAYGVTGVTLAYATREQLVVFLLSGKLPESNKAATAIDTTSTDPIMDAFNNLQHALANRKSNAIDDEAVTNIVSALVESKMIEIDSRVAESVTYTKELHERIAQGNKLFLEQLENQKPREVHYTYTLPSNVVITGDKPQHKLTPLLMALIQCPEVNIALVGPAGSGKSRVCKEIADMLDYDYTTTSFNILSSKTDILGYKDANGNYHTSTLETCMRNGGIYVADEFDACHAGIATILNSAIANRRCTFASGETVEAHEKFVFIACLNTFGTGATAEYVGRNRLDAATLDRFVFVQFGYDDSLESLLTCGVPLNQEPVDLESGGKTTPAKWLLIVQKARSVCVQHGIKTIISPRASITGAKLASMGIGKTHLIDMLLIKGLPENHAQLIRNSL